MNETLTEEQEQLRAIGAWLKANALFIVAVVTLVAGFFLGPNAWQAYKNSQIFPASDAYQDFLTVASQVTPGIQTGDSLLEQIDQSYNKLLDRHGDSHYALLASLRVAKISMDEGNHDAAFDRLKWAEEHAKKAADKQLINFRLAIVEAEKGDIDSALTRLKNPSEHFAALFGEARGDILMHSGRREEAIEAYNQVLSVLPEVNSSRRLIEAKLNRLNIGLGATSDNQG